MCYYFWAINFSFCLHIYLYPHILQANCYFHTLAKWLSCRVLKCCACGRGAGFDTWAFVLNKEMCRLHVWVLYLQNRVHTLIPPPLIIFYDMWNGVWQYLHALEKRNSRRNGKDLASDSSASHSYNPRQLLRKSEYPCAKEPWWWAGCSSPWSTGHISPNSEGTQVQHSGRHKDPQNNVVESLASIIFLKVFLLKVFLGVFFNNNT